MKRILVTGGAGFVGSHLCHRLIREGNMQVTCMDDLSTGDFDNIVDLIPSIDFDFRRVDVTTPYHATYDYFDEIYNLACPASPIQYKKDPIKTNVTCFIGALNMLNIARRCNAKILQASTSEVYGNPLVSPQHETYFGNVNPIGERACYDEGKRAAESLFFDYHRQHNTRIKVIRIFNTYGENMQPDDGRVVSNFILNALEGKDLTIYGDGKQTRSFQYIDDLIEGMLKMMDSEGSITGPINIGNPAEYYTIKELANMIIDLTKSSSNIVYKTMTQDDPIVRQPDISLAHKYLDWKPSIKLENGLMRTITYFRKKLEQEKAV